MLKRALTPGPAIRHALGSLGFAGVTGVRQGKVIELDLRDRPRTAEAAVKAMCEKLLSNTVIESYRIEWPEGAWTAQQGFSGASATGSGISRATGRKGPLLSADGFPRGFGDEGARGWQGSLLAACCAARPQRGQASGLTFRRGRAAGRGMMGCAERDRSGRRDVSPQGDVRERPERRCRSRTVLAEGRCAGRCPFAGAKVDRRGFGRPLRSPSAAKAGCDRPGLFPERAAPEQGRDGDAPRALPHLESTWPASGPHGPSP